jgi:hypothetical protein
MLLQSTSKETGLFIDPDLMCTSATGCGISTEGGEFSSYIDRLRIFLGVTTPFIKRTAQIAHNGAPHLS